MSRVVEDDKTFRKLLDFTLREKKLLNTLLSKEKPRSQGPGVGVLQTRFSPCPLSAKEREAISVLRKEKNYSTLNNNSTADSDGNPDDAHGHTKKQGTMRLSSGSGSRKGTKGARISLKGETCDINVSLSDEAVAAFRNANQRHKEELGKCWTSRIPKEFIPKAERHETGNLIREMAMEKVSFFLTFDRTPASSDYYEKIFNYVNGIEEEEEDDDSDFEECYDDDEDDIVNEGFGGSVPGMGRLSFRKFDSGSGGCHITIGDDDGDELNFDDDEDSGILVRPPVPTAKLSFPVSSYGPQNGGVFLAKYDEHLTGSKGGDDDDLKDSDHDLQYVNANRGLPSPRFDQDWVSPNPPPSTSLH